MSQQTSKYYNVLQSTQNFTNVILSIQKQSQIQLKNISSYQKSQQFMMEKVSFKFNGIQKMTINYIIAITSLLCGFSNKINFQQIKLRQKKILICTILSIGIFMYNYFNPFPVNNQIVSKENQIIFQPRIVLFQQIIQICLDIPKKQTLIIYFEYEKTMKMCANVTFQISSDCIPFPGTKNWTKDSLKMRRKAISSIHYQNKQLPFFGYYNWQPEQFNAINQIFYNKIQKFAKERMRDHDYIEYVKDKVYFLPMMIVNYFQYFATYLGIDFERRTEQFQQQTTILAITTPIGTKQ